MSRSLDVSVPLLGSFRVDGAILNTLAVLSLVWVHTVADRVPFWTLKIAVSFDWLGAVPSLQRSTSVERSGGTLFRSHSLGLYWGWLAAIVVRTTPEWPEEGA